MPFSSPHIPTLQLPDSCETIALCGGPYSNFAAVEAFLTQTACLPHRFCLGDIGGFGPHPNLTLSLLRTAGLTCIQGNYDDAIGNGLIDCGCGYADPKDRHFAQVSYDYTYHHTNPEHRQWLRSLPPLLKLQWRDRTILLCHGSPDLTNEFVWQSETDSQKIADYLQRYNVDGICATHSGLPWIKTLDAGPAKGGFWFNVGVLGRPANTGKQSVNYGLLHWPANEPSRYSAPLPELVSLDYNVEIVANAMRSEGLPEEFALALETGIWTTCAAILPAVERRQQTASRPITASPIQNLALASI